MCENSSKCKACHSALTKYMNTSIFLQEVEFVGKTHSVKQPTLSQTSLPVLLQLLYSRTALLHISEDL